MSDITSLTLTQLIKNIKDKNISSEELTKAFVVSSEEIFLSLIFLTNSVKESEVISDIIQQPLEQQKNLRYLQVNFLWFVLLYFDF